MIFDRSQLPASFAAILGDCLDRDIAQLGSQLRARLDPAAIGHLNLSLQEASARAPVHLLHPSVARPGGPLLASIPRSGPALLLDSTGTLFVRHGAAAAGWQLNALNAPTLRYILPVGHAEVTALAEGPGDPKLIAGYSDGSVRTGAATFQIHHSAVEALAIHPEGAYAVSMAGDLDAKLWDPLTGKTLLGLEPTKVFWEVEFDHWAPNSAHRALQVTRSKILLHAGHEVLVWCPRSGRLLWREPLDQVNDGGFALAPDGRRAILDGRLLDLETTTATSLQQIQPARFTDCRRAVFSRDGKYLFHTATGDARLFVRDGATLELSHTLDAGECDQLLADHTGRVITLGSRTRWWDPSVPEPPEPPLMRCPRLGRISLDHHGFSGLVTGRWTTRLCYPIAGLTRPSPGEGVLSPDGEYLVRDGRKYRLPGNTPAWPPDELGELVAQSANAAFALYSQNSGELHLVDYAAEVVLPVTTLLPAARQRLAADCLPYSTRHLSLDGRFLACQYYGEPLCCWDLETGAQFDGSGIQGWVYQLGFAADGVGWLATPEMGLVTFWLGAGSVLQGGRLMRDEPLQIALAANGRGVAILGDTATIWHVAQSQSRALASFTFDFRLRSCAISGDGSLVAVGDEADRLHFLRVAGA